MVILVKPDKELIWMLLELAQKLRGYRGMKIGEIDNFFINVFLVYRFIDGIILNHAWRWID
jgi:putative ABC transport system permease protein